MIKYDFTTFMKSIPTTKDYQKKIEGIKYKLNNDEKMLDWFHLEKCVTTEALTKIKELSKTIKEKCDVFVVIGIGGSFLGAKAVIDALSPYFNKGYPEIIFAGTTISGSYLRDLLEYIKDKKIIINVISKSGTTLEPNIAFEVLYEFMQKKYSEEELKDRIIITTDKSEGKFRELVNEKGYENLEIPREIGGRYSVFTAAGLLPIALAGIDIDLLFRGAKECNIENAFSYAVIRDILYREGKKCESFTIYEPKLSFFAEWLKQLFGETQGKEKKGILPISVLNTRDLHSLGQYYQDGERILFETVISIEKTNDIFIDNKNKSLDEINSIATNKVAKAHYNGGVYSNIITINSLDEETLGHLIYFFEVAAATGAYLLDVNPFDQPGVNAYKDLINEELNKGE